MAGACRRTRPVAARDTSQPNTNNPGAQPAGGLLPAGPPAEGYFALGGGLRDRGWPPPPAAERRVATGAGGRIGPMIAEPTYEQVQALAIKLTQNLCKRVAAGDAELSEEEAFIVTVVEFYDRLGTADEVSLSRQHFVILRELANKMMLQTAAGALAAEQAPDTLH